MRRLCWALMLAAVPSGAARAASLSAVCVEAPCTVHWRVEGEQADARLQRKVVERVWADAGWKAVPGHAPAAEAPLREPTGDRVFSANVRFERAPDRVTVSLRSLHRPDAVFGRATVELRQAPRPAWREGFLRTGVREAVQLAGADLRQRIDEALGLVGRQLGLSFLVSGLPSSSREHLRDVVLPCLRRLYATPKDLSGPREVAGYLEYRMEYRPGADEPREPLGYHRQKVEDALRRKGRCAVAESPLGKYEVRVTEDALNGGLRVVFRG